MFDILSPNYHFMMRLQWHWTLLLSISVNVILGVRIRRLRIVKECSIMFEIYFFLYFRVLEIRKIFIGYNALRRQLSSNEQKCHNLTFWCFENYKSRQIIWPLELTNEKAASRIFGIWESVRKSWIIAKNTQEVTVEF